MTRRRLAGLVVSALGLGLLAVVAAELLPFGLALAAVVGLGGVGVLVVLVVLGRSKEN